MIKVSTSLTCISSYLCKCGSRTSKRVLLGSVTHKVAKHSCIAFKDETSKENLIRCPDKSTFFVKVKELSWTMVPICINVESVYQSSELYDVHLFLRIFLENL